MNKEQLHVIVQGRVQGVGFRAHTVFLARKLNLSGTVQNLPDGTVEICAQGPLEKLQTLLHQLEQEFELDPDQPMKITFSPIHEPLEEFTILR